MESPQALEELMASVQRLGRLLASRRVASRITTAAGVDVTQQGMTLLRPLLRDGSQPVASLAPTSRARAARSCAPDPSRPEDQ